LLEYRIVFFWGTVPCALHFPDFQSEKVGLFLIILSRESLHWCASICI
jgi:hypothetical protein